jgi:hypothetical protein
MNKEVIPMRNLTEWSEEQQERTRDVLERMNIVAFSFSMIGKKKGCPLEGSGAIS